MSHLLKCSHWFKFQLHITKKVRSGVAYTPLLPSLSINVKKKLYTVDMLRQSRTFQKIRHRPGKRAIPNLWPDRKNTLQHTDLNKIKHIRNFVKHLRWKFLRK